MVGEKTCPIMCPELAERHHLLTPLAERNQGHVSEEAMLHITTEYCAYLLQCLERRELIEAFTWQSGKVKKSFSKAALDDMVTVVESLEQMVNSTTKVSLIT